MVAQIDKRIGCEETRGIKHVRVRLAGGDNQLSVDSGTFHESISFVTGFIHDR
jgi:hypothetical protein